MAVGGDGLQRALVGDQQHAVEVVADVLLRHRELGEAEQPLEVALRQRQRLQLVGAEPDARIVGGGERLQVEARARRAHGHLAAGGVDGERRVVGERAQQVLHLARGDCDRLRLLARQLGMRGDLHLEVGGRHEEPAVAVLEQDIGENRQRMAALDDPRHRLQRFQQRIAGYLLQLHYLNRITANRRGARTGTSAFGPLISAGWTGSGLVDNCGSPPGHFGDCFRALADPGLTHKL